MVVPHSEDPSALRERIYQMVASIPPGRVASYGQLAALAGLPGRARWVGKVLNELPGDSQLPWHRVLRADGKLPFPAGSAGAVRQQQRLQDEGITITSGRLNLRRYQWRP